MNLLDSRKAGLVAILALFLLACETDESISLPFDPNIDNLNAHYTEITLPFSLVQLDSINTTRSGDNPKPLLVGNYVDETFGTVNAVSYNDFNLASEAAIAADDVFDSLTLMVVNNYFYGEEVNLTQTLSVFQLQDTIASGAHYSFESQPYRPAALGSVTFAANLKAASARDTLRIRLDDAVGQDLFAKLKDKAPEVSSDSVFRIYFKGIALVSGTENRFMTGFDPARIRMLLYYSAPSETESSTYSFNTSPLTTYNTIRYDRTGTPIAGINMPGTRSQATDSGFYLQSGTGLAALLDFKPLVNFVNNIRQGEDPRNLLFNQVSLHIGVGEAGSQPPPATLAAFDVNDALKIKTGVPAGTRDPSPVPVGLFSNTSNPPQPSPIEFDTVGMAYDLNITNYMQSLVDSNSVRDRFILNDGSFAYEDEFLLRADDLQHTLNQIAIPADSVKLQIYYTTLD